MSDQFFYRFTKFPISKRLHLHSFFLFAIFFPGTFRLFLYFFSHF